MALVGLVIVLRLIMMVIRVTIFAAFTFAMRAALHSLLVAFTILLSAA